LPIPILRSFRRAVVAGLHWLEQAAVGVEAQRRAAVRAVVTAAEQPQRLVLAGTAKHQARAGLREAA
jgi:hypothetical protein